MRNIKTDISERVETGALQINDDWAGLFIRGDDAIQLARILGKILRYETLFGDELFVLEKYYLEIDRRVLQNNRSK